MRYGTADRTDAASASLRRCSLVAHAMWAWLRRIVDAHGRTLARPGYVSENILPVRDDITPEAAAGWLEEWEAASMIVRYTVDDVPYLQIVGWDESITADLRKKRGPSQIPPPPGSQDGDPTLREVTDHSQSSLSQAEAEAEKEGKAEAEAPARLPAISMEYALPAGPPAYRKEGNEGEAERLYAEVFPGRDRKMLDACLRAGKPGEVVEALRIARDRPDVRSQGILPRLIQDVRSGKRATRQALPYREETPIRPEFAGLG